MIVDNMVAYIHDGSVSMIKMDLSNFKIGFEYSTAIQWDKTTQTNYVNLSASGWWIIAAYIFVTSGQSMPQPTLAY